MHAIKLHKKIYTVAVLFYGIPKGEPEEGGDFVLELEFRDLPDLDLHNRLHPNKSGALVSYVKERFEMFKQLTLGETWSAMRYKKIESVKERTELMGQSYE